MEGERAVLRTGAPQPEVLLTAKGLGYGQAFRDISFPLHRGEILGITGLSDSGRNELAMALSGHLSTDSGSLFLDGQPVRIGSPSGPGNAWGRSS